MDCSAVISILLATYGTAFRCYTDDIRTRIVTPFRRPGGDLIEIFIRPQTDGSFVVSDLGESVGFLISMGYDPRAGTNSAFILKNIPHRYDVEFKMSDGLIRKHCQEVDLAVSMHQVLETSLAISYMLYLSRPSQAPAITQEVAIALQTTQISFKERVPVIGESGRQFHPDFELQGSGSREGFVRTLSADTTSGRLHAVNSAYRMWEELQGKGSMFASVVDDRYAEWADEDIGALSKYSTVYFWGSEQERFTSDVRRFAVLDEASTELFIGGRLSI